MAKIDALFTQLISEKGSDLHLAQGQKPKIRLNGSLRTLDNHDQLNQDSLIEILKEISSDENWNHFEHTGDLDFAYSLGEDARFRANYFRQFHGYGAIFRLIPSKILTLEDLGLPQTIHKLCKVHSGLILVTGPTGSGKSTTLAAMINEINATQTKKIITIEEPVEFIHQNKKCIITHREVGLDTKSFAEGLKGATKSDANIILVGEMRDKETIKLALTAAEMGILVFGTLHTNSAAKTIDRVIDVFPANQKDQIRTVLSNTLKGVISQQLLKSVDGTRRWVAYELLLRSPALRSIILSGETTKLINEIQMNSQMGMVLMDNCLKELVAQKKISKEEAYLKALDKSGFKTEPYQ